MPSHHFLQGKLQTSELIAPTLTGLTQLPGASITDDAWRMSERLQLAQGLDMQGTQSIQRSGVDKLTVTAGGVAVHGDITLAQGDSVKLGNMSLKATGLATVGISHPSLPMVFGLTGSISASADVHADGTVTCSSIICDNPPWVEVELDPVFTASPAYGITQLMVNRWEAAHSWGDHGAEGYLKPISGVLPLDVHVNMPTKNLAASTISASAATAGTVTAYTTLITEGSLRVDAGVGFYGTTPKSKQTVTGSTDTQKLNSLLNALDEIGLITKPA